MPAERPRHLPGLRSGASGLLAALLLLAAVPARSQSLLELYEAARGYDAAYLSTRALTESAIYRAAQADALMRPNAALAGSATASETKLPVFDSYRFGSTASLALNGRQPLFNRANGATIDQAYKSLESAQQDLFAAEQDLILRLSQAYFDVLAAQDTLATTRASKTAIAEQLAAAKRNFEVGTATITDTREAQARFDLATAQEIAAENDLRTRRIALDQLVGRSDVVPLPLAVPVALPPVQPPVLEEWVARAEAEHPTVQRARLARDVASIEVEKARAGHLPTLDAVAQLANTRNNGGASTFGGTTRSASLGLQLNVPIYSGYSVTNRVRETLLLEEKARSDLDAARRAVAQATRQAFFTVQSGRAQVQAFEAAESSSQLALEATQLGYRVGVRINVDVLNSQSQLYTTRRDLARARYEVLLGSLRLRQASGRLGPEDVVALDRLLAARPVPAGAGTAAGGEAGTPAGREGATTTAPARTAPGETPAPPPGRTLPPAVGVSPLVVPPPARTPSPLAPPPPVVAPPSFSAPPAPGLPPPPPALTPGGVPVPQSVQNPAAGRQQR